ncbi:MAG: S-layer homology domain-containing protein [Candidatus Altimarinota bacterium]
MIQLTRKIFALFLMMLIISQTFLLQTTQAQTNLNDIGDAQYKSSIEYLVGVGVLQGNPDGSFRPYSSMTRAEFITVMVRAFGSTQNFEGYSNCFTDVHNEWYAGYVCYAKENGLVKGHPDGSFKPAANVSYVEAMAMATAAAEVEVNKATTGQEWYEPFLEFAHNNNIFSKYSMLPGAALSREKAAFLIQQILFMQEGFKKISTTRKNYSAGCGQLPPPAAPSSVNVDGTTRNMITVIPSGYNKDNPLKLIFAFHGRTNSNEMVRGYYKVEQAAKGEAIMVYPAGLRSGSGYAWTGKKDQAFFDTMLAQLSQSYCIDLDEIYAVGHSLGGSMTNELACVRGDVLRGIAVVGGGSVVQNNCSGPVAAMIWHNPKDNLVAFRSGEIARDNIKRQNQLGDRNYPVEPLWAHCVAYTDGQKDAPLVWCPHTQDNEHYGSKNYYPHVWPRDAGEEIWKFFEGLD